MTSAPSPRATGNARTVQRRQERRRAKLRAIDIKLALQAKAEGKPYCLPAPHKMGVK
jgi:hypothetical protein